MTKELSTNAELSHYRIVSKIGAGGMGEVYLAQDTKLDRKVALKVLPEDVVSDGERLRRFEQEARAASALNHPNILTIYEIGEHEGNSYISTEFVDGKTLRQIMNGKGFSLHQAIEISVQAASALSAAHEAGIIHRDIKPENIMVRPDGLVKVLDFGLAKLSEATASGSEDATRAQVKTAPGVIMGTVQYMSPEQTRGKNTDARSDIWSLGCVMYEMLGGRAPFAGETTADLIAEIVKGYPIPLTKISTDIPERLDEIVAKTLEKDPDERFQSVKDLLLDLRRLKKKLDTDVELDRSHSPTSESMSDPRDLATRALSVAASDTIAGQTTISGTEALTSNIKQHKIGAAAALVIAAVVLAGFGYGLYRFLENPQAEQPRTNADLKTQRLTGDGKVRESVISPDGKFLVYKRVEDEKESLWIRQIQTNSNVQVVQAGELIRIGGLAFAPDGNFVYFNAENPEGETYTIYKVPTLGGSPTKFLSNAFGIAFSPDGKQIAFGRWDGAVNEQWVTIAIIDGTNERKLAARGGKQFFASRPSWSPDGKTLAIVLGDDGLLPGPPFVLGLISTADGSISEHGSRKWALGDSGDLVWTPSGDRLLIVATEYLSGPGQVWEVEYPSGESRRLTNTLSSYNSISITSDGQSISLTEGETRSSVWVSPNTDPNAAKQIMPAKGDTWGISWTPDGRIVYVSDQSGDYEIWSMNADGSSAKQLTSDRISKFTPVVSPDGRYIVYGSATGGGQLFRIDIGGGNPVQLTSAVGGNFPDISSDSKWVLYGTYIDGRGSIVRMSIEGGEPQRLYDGFAIAPRYSPDGRYFACFVLDEKSARWNTIAIVPSDGGEAIKTFEAPPSLNVNRGPVWTPDGKGITFLDSRGEKTNLWVQPIDGGKPKQLTNFGLPVIARREYSRDGKQIAIVRGEHTANAVLITGFR